MANKKSTPITASIATILPREEIETLARELGVVTRQRKVQVFALVTVLTMAYQSGTTRTIAAMRETYEKLTNTPLTRNAFYKRFTKALAGLLRRLVLRVLEQEATGGRSIAGGVLSQFRDLVIVDSTVLRLKDRLSKTFPACWTSHTKAAAKLHMVYGVGSARLSQVKLTAERVSDQTPWRKIGDWVRGSLVAFDLGYCNYQLFDRIEQHGGWFVTRLKRNVHATIVSENRPCKGTSRTMLGKRLKEVLPGLRRGVLDVIVEVTFRHRVYLGRRRYAKRTFRIVAVRNPKTRGYHTYLTNVPASVLTATEVAQTYGLRWQVELLFKGLKHHGRLDQLPSGKQEVVECFIWASLLAQLLSEALFRRVRAETSTYRHTPLLRWAAVLSRFSMELLHLALKPHQTEERILFKWLLRAAVDPNVNRRDRAGAGLLML
jgi:IS4 transposase